MYLLWWPRDQSRVNHSLRDLAVISIKLMHSAAKDKAQNAVRQRLSYANKKGNTSGKEAVKCTRKERLEMTEEAYGEYLASSSLNDFYQTLSGHFCLLEDLRTPQRPVPVQDTPVTQASLSILWSTTPGGVPT